MSAAAIEIRGLKKSFGTFTLGPLDLTVPVGAIYGFVGPNGAGKTTTMDLLMGMGVKDDGSIRVNGLDHRRDHVEMKRQVGYVSPELNYLPWGKVGRVVQFVKGFYPSWDQDYCDRLMTQFELEPHQRIRTLSFGARTKLTLVLALAWRPKVLILDEPTTGLDPIARRQMFAELLAAVQDEGRTVFISSHAVSDLERFADHIGMIRGGRLVFEASTAEVAERFRLVDFVVDRDVSIADLPGMVVQEQGEGRTRALVDLNLGGLDAIRSLGARRLTESPVSLEDLFVALGRA
jgi:ABC-2 type transport system ATP-binding protein